MSTSPTVTVDKSPYPPLNAAPSRRAWVEVDLQAIERNTRALAALAAPAALMAVVKADAYGHGAVPVARAALGAGASYLGVASVDEGVELRRAGIEAPVLVLGVGSAADPPEAFARYRLSATVSTLEGARRLADEAVKTGWAVPVHLKVDTGMGRLGVLPQGAAPLARALAQLEGICLEGIYTHLATAEEPDPAYFNRQAERFEQVLQAVEAAGVRVRLRHMLNTAGLLSQPRWRLDMVRAGIGLYGLYPAAHLQSRVSLVPALRLFSRVLEVRRLPAGSPIGYGRTYVLGRPSTVATLGLGYADGLPRALSGQARALIGGRLYPVVGRICMDQCMVDVGDDLVEVGQEACLLGPGVQGEMTADEMAARVGTISYEILTRLGPRLPRVYR